MAHLHIDELHPQLLWFGAVEIQHVDATDLQDGDASVAGQLQAGFAESLQDQQYGLVRYAAVSDELAKVRWGEYDSLVCLLSGENCETGYMARSTGMGGRVGWHIIES
jgi:hypothetical protein